MKMWAVALALGLASAGHAAAAESRDGLTLSAAMRLRAETISGQARAGFDRDDSLFNVRTQIAADYRRDDWQVGAELFDSRVYGDDRGTPVSTGEVNALELVQAYVRRDIRAPLGAGSRLSLTAGRMTLNLGSRRLVAADDYRNTTNGYTGLRADLVAPHGVSAVAIYTLPQQRRPDDREGLARHRVRFDHEGFDLVLWGGIVDKAGLPGGMTVEATYFHLRERDEPGRPTRDRSLDTWGGRIVREPKAGFADFEVEAFRQTGHVSASALPGAARLPVSAGFFHADAGYSFPVAWAPRLSAEFDWASGDRPGGRYGRFDTLFGMRRADLAPAGLYNAIARTNILGPGVRFEATPGKAWDGFLGYRAFWLASRFDAFSATAVRDPAGASGRFAGHQMEARVRYWLIPRRLRFEYDGVALAKGAFLRDAPNAPAGRWTLYHSFNLTASL